MSNGAMNNHYKANMDGIEQITSALSNIYISGGPSNNSVLLLPRATQQNVSSTTTETGTIGGTTGLPPLSSSVPRNSTMKRLQNKQVV